MNRPLRFRVRNKRRRLAGLRSVALGLLISATLQADDASIDASVATHVLHGMGRVPAPAVPPRPVQGNNAIVDYNLAIRAQPRAGTSVQQRAWLKAAAREGLVTAYRRLQPGSVQPGMLHGDGASRAKSPTRNWLQSQDPRRYTLQLASSTDQTSLQQLFARHKLVGHAQLFLEAQAKPTRDPRYTLVYGSYRTAHAARAAIHTLPPELQQWKPWVRNIREMQQRNLPQE